MHIVSPTNHISPGVKGPETRLPQYMLITSFLAFSWLAMQATHELGHVAATWATGGSVKSVVLHPFAISRTDLAANPHPLVVTWAGPLAGSLLPVAALLIARAIRIPGIFMFRFFAGFCLIINGGYIFFDSFWHYADGGDLIRHGARQWQLLLFGLITFPAGIGLWHGMGPYFGIGNAGQKVGWKTAITSCSLLVLIILLEYLVF